MEPTLKIKVMRDLKLVKDFIKNCTGKELQEVINIVQIRKSEIRYDIKDSFNVGDLVGIDHKTIPPTDQFRIVKINSKNIKVTKVNIASINVAGVITVSPSLLIKK